MDRRVLVTLTNMCMIYDGEGNVLVQDRVNPNWPGITFPGGHIKTDESLTTAVIREVREETGLTIASPRLVGAKDWLMDDGSRYMVLLYKTNQYTGELRSSAEGKVFWTHLETMHQLPLASEMDKMLRLFLEEDLSEHFFFQEDGEWRNILL